MVSIHFLPILDIYIIKGPKNYPLNKQGIQQSIAFRSTVRQELPNKIKETSL